MNGCLDLEAFKSLKVLSLILNNLYFRSKVRTNYKERYKAARNFKNNQSN